MSTKKISLSQNSMYNMFGTVFYCFCQWITSAILVVHLSLEEYSLYNSGLLQLSITVTNIFFAISCYNMRTYQISDVKNEYSYGDYIGTRIITAVIAVVLCLIYVIVSQYSAKTILCIMAYMFYKLNETFSDVLHAIDQKNHRMDYICVSYCMRGISSVAVFAIALQMFNDVMIAIVSMGVVCVLEVLLYDVKVAKQFGSVKPIFNKNIIVKLLIVCMPAVVSSAAFTAITSVPRQILEAMLGEEALGYYGTIATPLLVVQIMATSIFNPMLTQLAEFYNNGHISSFARRIIKNLGLLVCISSVVYVGIAIFGKFAVGLVFGQKFVPYTYLMYGIIGCTTMYVISWLCTSTLIIMRSLKVCAEASIIALCVSAVLAKPFIAFFGMNGVSYSIIIAYAIHITVCFTVIYKNLKFKGRENELHDQ